MVQATLVIEPGREHSVIPWVRCQAQLVDLVVRGSEACRTTRTTSSAVYTSLQDRSMRAHANSDDLDCLRLCFVRTGDDYAWPDSRMPVR